jgi:hypothetical protein
LRDDVKNLFFELYNLTSKKLEALQNLSASEAQKKFCFDTGKTDDLLSLIEKDTQTVNSINSIDCEIRKIENELCGIIGIPSDKLSGYIKKRREKIIVDFKNKIYDINLLLKILIKSRDELAAAMESSLNDIDKDIRSIRLVRELKKTLHQSD